MPEVWIGLFRRSVMQDMWYVLPGRGLRRTPLWLYRDPVGPTVVSAHMRRRRNWSLRFGWDGPTTLGLLLILSGSLGAVETHGRLRKWVDAG
jgi:hypothetical protein